MKPARACTRAYTMLPATRMGNDSSPIVITTQSSFFLPERNAYVEHGKLKIKKFLDHNVTAPTKLKSRLALMHL
jgi:hypothetical protein